MVPSVKVHVPWHGGAWAGTEWDEGFARPAGRYKLFGQTPFHAASRATRQGRESKWVKVFSEFVNTCFFSDEWTTQDDSAKTPSFYYACTTEIYKCSLLTANAHYTIVK